MHYRELPRLPGWFTVPACLLAVFLPLHYPFSLLFPRQPSFVMAQWVGEDAIEEEQGSREPSYLNLHPSPTILPRCDQEHVDAFFSPLLEILHLFIDDYKSHTSMFSCKDAGQRTP